MRSLPGARCFTKNVSPSERRLILESRRSGGNVEFGFISGVYVGMSDPTGSKVNIYCGRVLSIAVALRSVWSLLGVLPTGMNEDD